MEILLNIVISLFIFIFLLGIVVFIHELGHFVAAKKAGVYVQEFAFGFGRAIWKRKYKGTEYRINLYPLGGYVKMLGDQDGSSFLRYNKKKYDHDDKKYALNLFKNRGIDIKKADYNRVEDFVLKIQKELGSEDYKKLQNFMIYDYIPAHPGNYDNVPSGKRAIVISAGVIMNFILAIILFYIFFFFTGFYTDVRKIGDPVFTGVSVSNPPYLYFLTGSDNTLYSDSIIIRANDKVISSEEELNSLIASSYNIPIDLDLQKLTDSSYYFTSASLVLNGDGIKSNFDLDILESPYISKVNENSLAEMIGIKPGNFLLELAGVIINKETELSDILMSNKDNVVRVKYFDNMGDVVDTELYLRADDQGEVLLGITYFYPDQYPDFILRLDYNDNKLLSGISHTINMAVYNFTGLGELVKQSLDERSIEPVSSGVSSIVGVSDFVYNLVKIDDFINIINLTALVSLSLGIMNILPIPLFDGGHLLFILLEKIRGRKLSEKTQERIATISFYSLIILSVLIIFKDIWQFNFLDRLRALFSSIFGI